MNAFPYLKVGDKTITLADLFCAFFGDENDMPLSVTADQLRSAGLLNIQLCVDTRMGAIIADPSASVKEYPCLELALQPLGPDDVPILMARTEVDQTSSKPIAPETFLYSRGESYIAHMPVDTRPADVLDEVQDLRPELYVSGDPGVTVQVIPENQHYNIDKR